MQHDHRAVDGSVLWIVNHAANGAEDIGEGDTTRQEQAGKYEPSESSHTFYLFCQTFFRNWNTQLPPAPFQCGGPNSRNCCEAAPPSGRDETEGKSSSHASLPVQDFFCVKAVSVLKRTAAIRKIVSASWGSAAGLEFRNFYPRGIRAQSVNAGVNALPGGAFHSRLWVGPFRCGRGAATVMAAAAAGPDRGLILL
jgi:hypothetical protein